MHYVEVRNNFINIPLLLYLHCSIEILTTFLRKIMHMAITNHVSRESTNMRIYAHLTFYTILHVETFLQICVF